MARPRGRVLWLAWGAAFLVLIGQKIAAGLEASREAKLYLKVSIEYLVDLRPKETCTSVGRVANVRDFKPLSYK